MRLSSLLLALLCSSVSLAAAVPQTSHAMAAPHGTPTAVQLVARAPSALPVPASPVSSTSDSTSASATCIASVPPGKDGYRPPSSCDAYYNYFPNFSAAVAFGVLFGILLVAHLGQAIYHRNGYGWVIVMAALWEFAAYVTRALGSKNQQELSLAITTQLITLLAPLWVNAFAYMVFARIVHFYAPSKKVWVFSPSALTVVFVTLDIVSFFVQATGGSMAGPNGTPQQMMTGIHIYMGGIGLQEFFILVFTVLAVKFHRDQLRAERNGTVALHKTDWRPVLYALYGCLAAITVRIIFRLAEFSAGTNENNRLPYTEGYFYGLDSIPMLVAVGLWNVCHPGRFMQGPDAKLPRSWISRKLCCCCCCFRRKPRDEHGARRQAEEQRGEELLRLPSYREH